MAPKREKELLRDIVRTLLPFIVKTYGLQHHH